MGDKQKWAAADAGMLAAVLCAVLGQFCKRIEIAGSVRRGRRMVSDLEILYVPKVEVRVDPKDFFAQSSVNLAEECIEKMLATGELAKRPNSLGTGMPVDLFSTTADNFFMSLVIRTGPKEFNLRLIESARRAGLLVHAYGVFERMGTGEKIIPKSEREVLEIAGLEWTIPEHRA